MTFFQFSWCCMLFLTRYSQNSCWSHVNGMGLTVDLFLFYMHLTAPRFTWLFHSDSINFLTFVASFWTVQLSTFSGAHYFDVHTLLSKFPVSCDPSVGLVRTAKRLLWRLKSWSIQWLVIPMFALITDDVHVSVVMETDCALSRDCCSSAFVSLYLLGINEFVYNDCLVGRIYQGSSFAWML